MLIDDNDVIEESSSKIITSMKVADILPLAETKSEFSDSFKTLNNSRYKKREPLIISNRSESFPNNQYSQQSNDRQDISYETRLNEVYGKTDPLIAQVYDSQYGSNYDPHQYRDHSNQINDTQVDNQHPRHETHIPRYHNAYHNKLDDKYYNFYDSNYDLNINREFADSNSLSPLQKKFNRIEEFINNKLNMEIKNKAKEHIKMKKKIGRDSLGVKNKSINPFSVNKMTDSSEALLKDRS